jgi:hypothetical protein
LDFDTDAAKFEGGAVYQAFPGPLTYHRQHSPIKTTIKKLRPYQRHFAISTVNGYPNPAVFANIQPHTLGDTAMIAVGRQKFPPSTTAFSSSHLAIPGKDKNGNVIKIAINKGMLNSVCSTSVDQPTASSLGQMLS